jgi:RNA polymerase sigma factor (sigma-70 family)
LWEETVVKRLPAVLEFLRRVPPRETETDAALLHRFAVAGDQEAFAALVRRHGPMVLGVAHRVLGGIEDAEDVFQATFLVAARRAPSLSRPHLLGNWLHGVAYRTALEARRRRKPLGQLGDVPAPEATPGVEWADLRQVLDEEITRLPSKYRVPFVLHYLRGMTGEEAARLLGCPQGTVLSRLARARDRLRRRLRRRGVMPAVGLLETQVAPPATVSPGLLTTALRTVTVAGAARAEVLALANGVCKAMILAHLKKSAGLVLLAAAVVAGVGLFPGAPKPARVHAQEQTAPAPAAAKEAAIPPQFTALQLHVALSSNDARAEDMLGTRVRVRGIMNEVRRKAEAGATRYILWMAIVPPGRAMAALTGDETELLFEFRPEDRKALAALMPGHEVNIEGRYERAEDGRACFKDCKLIEAPGGATPAAGRATKEWAGRLADGELEKEMPVDGFITTKEDFAKLWGAWMGKEKLPEINFDKELVLVATFSKGRVFEILLIVGKGDAKAVVGRKAEEVQGFTFLIAVFNREGIKTIDGKPIKK